MFYPVFVFTLVPEFYLYHIGYLIFGTNPFFLICHLLRPICQFVLGYPHIFYFYKAKIENLCEI